MVDREKTQVLFFSIIFQSNFLIIIQVKFLTTKKFLVSFKTMIRYVFDTIEIEVYRQRWNGPNGQEIIEKMTYSSSQSFFQSNFLIIQLNFVRKYLWLRSFRLCFKAIRYVFDTIEISYRQRWNGQEIIEKTTYSSSQSFFQSNFLIIQLNFVRKYLWLTSLRVCF